MLARKTNDHKITFAVIRQHCSLQCISRPTSPKITVTYIAQAGLLYVNRLPMDQGVSFPLGESENCQKIMVVPLGEEISFERGHQRGVSR